MWREGSLPGHAPHGTLNLLPGHAPHGTLNLRAMVEEPNDMARALAYAASDSNGADEVVARHDGGHTCILEELQG